MSVNQSKHHLNQVQYFIPGDSGSIANIIGRVTKSLNN